MFALGQTLYLLSLANGSEKILSDFKASSSHFKKGKKLNPFSRPHPMLNEKGLSPLVLTQAEVFRHT